MGMSIIMITHDMGVVARTCDEVIVMYGGSICEAGIAEEIFYNPHHEYTKGLLRSIPSPQLKRLESIPGSAPNLINLPKGCPFSNRCKAAMRICEKSFPEAVKISDGHYARCYVNQKKLVERALSKDEN